MYLENCGKNIKKLVLQIAGQDNEKLVSLAFGWKKIVGKLLAERTFIRNYQNDRLFVSVTNNVWMHDLVLNKEKIKSEIFKRLNIKLKDIVFFLSEEKYPGRNK